jgi:hypothetical protein
MKAVMRKLEEGEGGSARRRRVWRGVRLKVVALMERRFSHHHSPEH